MITQEELQLFKQLKSQDKQLEALRKDLTARIIANETIERGMIVAEIHTQQRRQLSAASVTDAIGAAACKDLMDKIPYMSIKSLHVI